MEINQRGLTIIKESESLKLRAYLCPANVWTIAFGTTKYPNGKSVQANDTCTPELAESFLQHDLKSTCEQVAKAVKVELNENQFSALVSLVYNIGIGNFKKSTLLKKLNAGDYEEAANQFLVWRKGGGKVLKGLEIRRAKEKDLFTSTVNS